MKEEGKGTRGASKRAARAQRGPEANSRDSSNGLNREQHTSREETPQFIKFLSNYLFSSVCRAFFGSERGRAGKHFCRVAQAMQAERKRETIAMKGDEIDARKQNTDTQRENAKRRGDARGRGRANRAAMRLPVYRCCCC